MGALDSRLYLAEEPAALAEQLGVTVTRVNSVVDAVRQAGPPGTAARNLRECLLAQLDAMGSEVPYYEVVRAVVEDHLEALACGRLGEIARMLRVTTSEVATAHEVIRSRLRPCAVIEGNRPAARRNHRRHRRSWCSAHLRAAGTRSTFSSAAGSPSRSTRCTSVPPRRAGGTAACASTYVGRGDFSAGSDERWDMMRAVGEALALHQDAFLRYGPSHLCPLTRTQVARELDVHESTVCRAVSGKHAGLPDGSVIPLGTLFGASRAAPDALRELVLQEPQPMPDAMLAEAMRRRGFPTALCTVAKYRGMLDIPPVSRRRAGRSLVA